MRGSVDLCLGCDTLYFLSLVFSRPFGFSHVCYPSCCTLSYTLRTLFLLASTFYPYTNSDTDHI